MLADKIFKMYRISPWKQGVARRKFLLYLEEIVKLHPRILPTPKFEKFPEHSKSLMLYFRALGISLAEDCHWLVSYLSQ